MSNELKWTSEPTEEGLYWFRIDPKIYPKLPPKLYTQVHFLTLYYSGDPAKRELQVRDDINCEDGPISGRKGFYAGPITWPAFDLIAELKESEQMVLQAAR